MRFLFLFFFWQGEHIFNELIATHKRGVKIRVVQTQPSSSFPNSETETLREAGIEVRSLDMERLMGGGILHTKLWIVDSKHFYSGSANTDWRSLTQVCCWKMMLFLYAPFQYSERAIWRNVNLSNKYLFKILKKS